MMKAEKKNGTNNYEMEDKHYEECNEVFMPPISKNNDPAILTHCDDIRSLASQKK